MHLANFLTDAIIASSLVPGTVALPQNIVNQNESTCTVTGSGPYRYILDIGQPWDAGNNCAPAQQSLSASVGANGFVCGHDGSGYTYFSFQVADAGDCITIALKQAFSHIVAFNCPISANRLDKSSGPPTTCAGVHFADTASDATGYQYAIKIHVAWDAAKCGSAGSSLSRSLRAYDQQCSKDSSSKTLLQFRIPISSADRDVNAALVAAFEGYTFACPAPASMSD